MAGKVMGKVLVMARCQIVLSEKYGCVLRIGVRSESEGVVQTIISLLHWCVCCAFCPIEMLEGNELELIHLRE